MLKSIATISTIILLLSSTVVRAQDTLTVYMADQVVSDETQVVVPFAFLHFNSISDFSFSVQFDSTLFAFNSISYATDTNLKEIDFQTSLADAGSFGLLWIHPQAQSASVTDSVTIFNLVLDLKTDNRDSSNIIFGNNPTNINAGNVNGDELPFKTIGAAITFDQNSTSTFEAGENDELRLYQNNPNPFKEHTTIAFDLKKSEEVRFDVYDVDGRRIVRQQSFFPKGSNTIKLNKLQLNGSGVYQYSLSIKQKTITKKLVLLN